MQAFFYVRTRHFRQINRHQYPLNLNFVPCVKQAALGQVRE